MRERLCVLCGGGAREKLDDYISSQFISPFSTRSAHPSVRGPSPSSSILARIILPSLSLFPFQLWLFPPSPTPPRSLSPPSSHPSLSFHLPPIILFYTIPLTSDPRHHPNLSKKTVPSFPSPLYFSPFRVRARLSSLHTLIETFNAAPLRRGPPLIVSLPSPPNTLVPQQTTDRPTEPNLRLTTCPAH